MGRGTQNLLLLLTGLTVLLVVARGSYLNYVKQGLLPWLVASAVVLLALGLAGIRTDLRHGHAGLDEHTHHHNHNRLVWVLLIPIALLAFVVPPALDAEGVAAQPVAPAPSPRPFPPLPPGNAPVVPIPELMMRSAADSAHSLDGRAVTATGFTLKSGAGTDLGRVVIVCCAADAQLARIHLSGPESGALASYPDETWLRVVGTVVPGSARPTDGFVPTMTVTNASRIDKPVNTYAY